MDTEYERDQREQREDERRQAELDRDRRAEMAPPSEPPRTPRQRVEALICRAGEIGVGLPTSARAAPRLAELLRLLDRALVVLRDPYVVDGALLLCGKVEGALELVEEGEYAGDALREALELLSRPVYDDGDGIPTIESDFERAGEHVRKQQQVRTVLKRRQFELSARLDAFDDDLIDELIHAVEAPF